MSGTNSLFQANPFGNWQSQPTNALAPVNDASAVNSIYNINTASPQGSFYGEPGYQYPTTIQPQAAAPVATPQPAPAPAPTGPAYPSPYPVSPAYQTAYDQQMATNKAVYGTTDTQTLGMMGAAGFPLYSDPRLIQDRLAQTYQAGGPNAQAAYDEFLRQTGQQGSGYGSGGGGGGYG